ncbi:STAS domain-containing protein [Streptomyces sp. NPDC097107]|uniref:STAS domain-containing protein n=1 Tax=Streptomyces sp. NPDC097107 TaxID=3366089 RepID=UPI00382B2945
MTDILGTTVRYAGERTAVVVVAGDVDLLIAPRCVQAPSVVERGAPHLAPGLPQADNVDSIGLSFLIVQFHATREAGGPLRVGSVPDRLTRLVTMTGICDLLPILDTVADALAALAADRAGDSAGTTE